MQDMRQQHIDWSRNLVKCLEDGGVWAVPRSSLLFRKVSGTMQLVSRGSLREHLGDAGAQNPPSPSMEVEWARYQLDDFQIIRRHMTAAGIQVLDLTGLEEPAS